MAIILEVAKKLSYSGDCCLPRREKIIIIFLLKRLLTRLFWNTEADNDALFWPSSPVYLELCIFFPRSLSLLIIKMEVHLFFDRYTHSNTSFLSAERASFYILIFF